MKDYANLMLSVALLSTVLVGGVLIISLAANHHLLPGSRYLYTGIDGREYTLNTPIPRKAQVGGIK